MTSTNGSEPVQPGTPRGRTPRATSTSTDPEVLAAEIERTREDLAETLDAIADRVSPKRVADRTRKQLAVVVSEVTEQVKGRTAQVRGMVVEQAGHAREAALSARDAATGANGRHGAPSSGGSSHGVLPVTALPPVTAVQADGLDLRTSPLSTATAEQPTAPTPPTAPSTPPPGTGVPAVKPEVVAGGALGLLLLLLLRRRRRTRRAGGKVAVKAARARAEAAKAAKANAKARQKRRARR